MFYRLREVSLNRQGLKKQLQLTRPPAVWQLNSGLSISTQDNCRQRTIHRVPTYNWHLSHFIYPFFSPLQTRTLCSAMRRQMAIQLFIARMGSWIWQDIHALKLCKRVRRWDGRTDGRKDRRTDGQTAQHFNTHLNVFVHFIQLFCQQQQQQRREQAAHVISFTDRIQRRSTNSKLRKVSRTRWNSSWKLFSTRRKVRYASFCCKFCVFVFN